MESHNRIAHSALATPDSQVVLQQAMSIHGFKIRNMMSTNASLSQLCSLHRLQAHHARQTQQYGQNRTAHNAPTRHCSTRRTDCRTGTVGGTVPRV